MDRRQNYTTPEVENQNLVGESPGLAAHVIRKLIAGMPLNGYSSSLGAPWAEIVEAIQASPPNPTERTKAFEAAIASREDKAAVWQAVMAADLGADLDAFPQARPRYRIRNAAYALQPQDPIDWIVEKLFSAGSVSLVVGAPGSKKTYSMLTAAVCVALGVPWLGLQTKKSKVLIVDEESGDRRMARRLGEVLRGNFGDENTTIEYISLAQFNLRDPAEGVLLQALIEETGAELVIVDALADIMPGADENAVRDVHPVFMMLRKMAEETKAALVIIHHANKLGDYRGSTAISGAADLLLMVDSKDGSPNIDFETKKARDIEPFKFAATAHFSDGNMWLEPSEPAKQGEMMGKAERYVLRYLEDHGRTASIDDITSHADVCSPQSARQAVYKLADKKQIRRSDPGGQGSKATYTLMRTSQELPGDESE